MTNVESPETAVEPLGVPVPGPGQLPAETQEAKALRRERMANRVGPRHPAHWQHDRWLSERGLDRSFDRTLHYDD